MSRRTAANEFHTSSLWPVPAGFEAWNIRNDYPSPRAPIRPQEQQGEQMAYTESRDLPGLPGLPPIGADDAPWLNIDFRGNPQQYTEVIKEYCFEGMTNVDFVPQNNPIRPWYHAIWMHYGDSGREPLHGLTFERPTPPLELSKTQHRWLQCWAVGLYNSVGASVFGEVWADLSKPDWNGNLSFPNGTCVYKLLLSEATDKELPNMKGSPSWNAVIAQPPADPENPKTPPLASKRNTEPSPLRLFQVDFATRDDRSPIGWVFGTFIYDGRDPKRVAQLTANPWDGIIPVGLQWGNDPELTQEAFESGLKARELWINPVADHLRRSLGGHRPSWGWNGRMNGPADNFISACASCHSTAQRNDPKNKNPTGMTVHPPPKYDPVTGRWIPQDPDTMKWFRNIPAGKPFDEGVLSADYSLQMMLGWENYELWLAKNAAEERKERQKERRDQGLPMEELPDIPSTVAERRPPGPLRGGPNVDPPPVED